MYVCICIITLRWISCSLSTFCICLFCPSQIQARIFRTTLTFCNSGSWETLSNEFKNAQWLNEMVRGIKQHKRRGENWLPLLLCFFRHFLHCCIHHLTEKIKTSVFRICVYYSPLNQSDCFSSSVSMSMFLSWVARSSLANPPEEKTLLWLPALLAWLISADW